MCALVVVVVGAGAGGGGDVHIYIWTPHKKNPPKSVIRTIDLQLSKEEMKFTAVACYMGKLYVYNIFAGTMTTITSISRDQRMDTYKTEDLFQVPGGNVSTQTKWRHLP